MIEHTDLRLYYGASDEMTSMAAGHAAVAGEPVTCKSGCAACCYQEVKVSSSEAIGLAVFVMDHPELRASFQKYVENILKLWSKPSLVKRFKDKLPRANQRRDVHWEFQIPCPFLLKDHTCAAYEIRPLACRSYQVCSPPENCSPGGASQQVAIVRPSREIRTNVENTLKMTLLYDRFAATEMAFINENHGLLGPIVLRTVEALERRAQDEEVPVVGGPVDA